MRVEPSPDPGKRPSPVAVKGRDALTCGRLPTMAVYRPQAKGKEMNKVGAEALARAWRRRRQGLGGGGGGGEGVDVSSSKAIGGAKVQRESVLEVERRESPAFLTLARWGSGNTFCPSPRHRAKPAQNLQHSRQEQLCCCCPYTSQ